MQPVPASDVIELVVAVDFDREVLGVVLLDIDVDIGALVFADFLDAEAERSVVVLAVAIGLLEAVIIEVPVAVIVVIVVA